MSEHDWLEKVFGVGAGGTPLDTGPHPSTLADEQLLLGCDFGRSRSGGPGGQHRNKVETTVELTHRATEISAKAGERRSQIENKRMALFRLRVKLAVEHRVAVPRGDARSELWRSRAKGGKIRVNPSHHDFPALLAEAMDVLHAAEWEPKDAALRLDVTPTQLLKLVKDEPTALARVNEERAKRGKHVLK